MNRVAELGWKKMERYLPSWIHLYVHPSPLMFIQYDSLCSVHPSTQSEAPLKSLALSIFKKKIILTNLFCFLVAVLLLGCLSWDHTLALCPPCPLWFSHICHLEAKSISIRQIYPQQLPLSCSGCKGLKMELRNQQVMIIHHIMWKNSSVLSYLSVQ